MRYSIILLLPLFLFTDASAQNTSRFEVGIALNINTVARDQFSYFILEQTRELQYSQDAETQAMPSISISYLQSPRLSFTTGFQLYNFGHTSDRLEIPTFNRSEHKYRAYFLTLPIGANYKFINRKFKSYIGSSVLLDIYLGSKSTEPEFATLDVLDWRTLNMSTMINLGFQYPVSGFLNLDLSPYVTIPLHDYVTGDKPASVINIKPFRFGFTFGLKYLLN